MQDAMQKDSKSNSKNSSKTKKLTVNAVNNEQLLRTGSLQEESGSGEKRFLADVLEAYALWDPEWASRELEEWGGWWRNRVRENADKARRVLADIRSMIRERKIMQDPGKAAYDLWNRLP